MIPASALVDQSTLAALLEHDPLVQDYRAFFSLLDWSVVEQWFNPALVQALLQSTVRALQDEIPGLGDTVTFDVKHIYAWVKENNERASVPERYDKTKRLAGDPDYLCWLLGTSV